MQFVRRQARDDRNGISGPAAGMLAALLALAACSSLPPEQRPPVSGQTQAAPARSDSALRDDILQRWEQAGELQRRLDAKVEQGRALLTGRARNADERVEAVRLAWQTEGVAEVINEIQIDDKSGLSDQVTDTWIATQLRTKLLADPEITSGNFTMDVVNQTVYVMGKARSQQELERVLNHARQVPRVRRVVSHVRI